MQQTDSLEFGKILQAMALSLPPRRDLTKLQVDLWFKALAQAGWTMAEFRIAATHLFASSHFMPSPAEFEALRVGADVAWREAFQKAWDAAPTCVQIGRVTAGGSCGDAEIDAVVRQIGGYAELFNCQPGGRQWLEKRFSEAFEEYRATGAARQVFPAIASEAAARLGLSGARSLSGPQPILNKLLGPRQPADA